MSKRRYRLHLSKYEHVTAWLDRGVSVLKSPVVAHGKTDSFECTVDTDEAAAFVEKLGGESLPSGQS